MKKLIHSLLLLSFIFVSCNDENPTSQLPVNPEEEGVLEFYQMSVRDLQDWSEGITNKTQYITAAIFDNAPWVYVGSIDNNDGVLFRFNEAGEIQDISNGEVVLIISTHNNEQSISWISKDNEFCSVHIKNRFGNLDFSKSSRSNGLSLINPNNIRNLFDITQNIQAIGEIGSDLFTSDILEFLKDLGNFSFDFILSGNPLGMTIVSLKNMLEGMYDSLCERQRRAMYGDCSIQIEEISNDGKGNINVFISIEKANTIPDHLYHLYYNEPADDTRNIVYWGVVGRNGSVPRKYFFTDPYKELRLLDTSISSTQHLMVSFPMPKKGDKFIFRAFLASTRLANSIDDVNDNIIKYSESYSYNVLDAFVRDFKQISCCKVGNKVNFVCRISGYINSIDGLIEWGFYYKDDDDSYYYFPSKYTIGYSPNNGLSSPNEDTIEIPLSVDYDNFDENYYKDIRLGIYTKGGFNVTYNGWSEPQVYAVHYEFFLCPDGNHPHIIDLGLPSGTKWSCCNVGATFPEDYGNHYAWGDLNVWRPYSYPYYTYPQYGVDNYTDIGSNISGTQYDVAHMKMGGGWQMPTYAQMQELARYCKEDWTQLNGIEGTLVTGSNGRQIFLPALNEERDDGASLIPNPCGYYWSSNLVEAYPATASALFIHETSPLGFIRHNRRMGLSVRPCIPIKKQ